MKGQPCFPSTTVSRFLGPMERFLPRRKVPDALHKLKEFAKGNVTKIRVLVNQVKIYKFWQNLTWYFHATFQVSLFPSGTN